MSGKSPYLTNTTWSICLLKIVLATEFTEMFMYALVI